MYTLLPPFSLTHPQETDTSLYRPALEELRRQIRSSTTSMTSVPKPLKFLRPHYGKLKEIYEGMVPGENKVGKLMTVIAKWLTVHSGENRREGWQDCLNHCIASFPCLLLLYNYCAKNVDVFILQCYWRYRKFNNDTYLVYWTLQIWMALGIHVQKDPS